MEESYFLPETRTGYDGNVFYEKCQLRTANVNMKASRLI